MENAEYPSTNRTIFTDPTMDAIIDPITDPITEPISDRFLWWEFKTKLKWGNIVIFLILHGIALYGALTYNYLGRPWIPIFIAVTFVLTGFGITGGAHRYFTHRSYKAKLPLRIFLIACYATAGQNSIKDWVRDHTVHHKFSETDADPHNSKRGFFFSHIGWLMMKKHPDVIKAGKQVDLSYLYEDPLVRFVDRYFHWFSFLLCYVIPTILPMVLWGEPFSRSIIAAIFRQLLLAHCEFCVNSFAHFYGSKPYDTRIRPANHAMTAFVTFGEGFHNYHHTFPWDYRAHETASFFSVTTMWLNFFGKIGWAYDMKYPSQDLVERMAKKHGDGTYIFKNFCS